MVTRHAVIIPAYKAGWCLADCIESIHRQTIKPSVVMIGIDACEETRLAALTEVKKYGRRRGAKSADLLNIQAYLFPRHAGPYRIRNTLALMAHAEILHFFDADDIMMPNHLELMAKASKADRFMVAMAEKVEKGGKAELWHNAHGVVSLLKNTFIQHGGFRPWVCAADSEANARWQAGGLLMCRPKEPTMIVRKHDNGLTKRPDTGYQSPLRKAYKERIKQLTLEPERLDTIAIADCGPAEDPESITMHNLEVPQDKVIDALQAPPPKNEPDARDIVIARQAQALQYMCQVHGKGLSKLTRAAYDMALTALGRAG